MLDSLTFVTVNRTQALVLGFFLVVWVSLLVILVAAPEVFDQALRLPTDHRAVELVVLAGLAFVIAAVAIATAPAFSVYARLPAVVVTTGDAFGAFTVIVNDWAPDVFELGGVLLPLSLNVTLKVAVPLVPLVAV